MLNLAQLVVPQYIPATATNAYSATVVTRIDKLTVTNVTATAQTVTIYVVPVSGTAGLSNTITSAYSVAAGVTFNCPDLSGQVLAIGQTLVIQASAATSLVIMASGVQQS